MRESNLTEAQRAVLRKLCVAHPLMPRAKLASLFESRSGRSVSISTLARVRRESSAPPAPAASPQPNRRRVLSDPERAELARVFADHPRATIRQAANIFRARTGRRLSSSTVYYARADPSSLARSRRQLSPVHRDLLASIVAEAGPEFCRAQIRREFVALSGRPITSGCVSEFVRFAMGLPALPRGSNSGGSELRSRPRALAAASARKLDAAPVDRSPRPGRTGRAASKSRIIFPTEDHGS